MTDEINLPPQPAPTGNAFTDSKAQHAHFAEMTKAFKARQPQGVPVAPSQPSTGTQRTDVDLSSINATAKHLDADGKPAYFSNAKFREVIEKYRAEVFAGRPLDVVSAKAELHAALGIAPPVTAQPEAPVAPEGTPLERAEATLNQPDGHLDADMLQLLPVADRIELCSGYAIDLSGGYAITAEDVAQLRAARAAGLSQRQLDQIIVELRAGRE